MQPISVLITGCGAQGFPGTVYSLRENWDNRKITITGVDTNPLVGNRYICDNFETIAPATEESKYLSTLLKVCQKHNINIILPQNTAELVVLAANKRLFEEKDIQIPISDKDTIALANDKYKIYQIAEENNIPTPKFFLVFSYIELAQKTKNMEKFVIKPTNSNGSRGIRIIDPNINRNHQYWKEKPGNSGLFLQNIDVFKQITFSEPLMVCEFIDGIEYTVDLLRTAQTQYILPRRRDVMKNGITWKGTVKQHKTIINYSRELAEVLDIKNVFGFQWIEKKSNPNDIYLLECNPRIQGTMVISQFAGFNFVYGAVKIALKENIPHFSIKWDTVLHRYWGSIGEFNNKMITRV